MNYVLAIDAGTTQIKAALYNQDGVISALSEQKVDIYYPEPGLVEQDPEQIYLATVEAIRNTLQKARIHPEQVVALGISNQRINVIMWDTRTGKPVYNTMGWQDQRGPEMTPSLMTRQTVEFTLASQVTGKILWLFDRLPDLRRRSECGEVVFGGVDSWLLWKLTGGKVHATDVSNASTTILYDINRMAWNQELLAEVKVPLRMFPTVMDSSHIYGHVSTPDLEITCPISSLIADQQASLLGHRCFVPGQAKITFGTGSFVLVNMGNCTQLPPPGIIKHVAWSINSQPTFAMEGSILCAGSALEWLFDGIGLIDSMDELEPLATSVENNADVYFVPALAGLGSPSWDIKARGLLIGLTYKTQKAHIVRAVLESLAFQAREVIEAMNPIISKSQYLRIDGRPAMDNFLAQTLADVCGIPVERNLNYNTSLTGAAYLAGLATHFWSSMDEISNLSADYEVFSPQCNMDKLYSRWQEAVRRSHFWLS